MILERLADQQGVYLTEDEIYAPHNDEAERFRGSGHGSYDALFDNVAAYRPKNFGASVHHFVPAIQFAANVTMRVLVDPTCAAQLPTEIQKRASIASDVTRVAVMHGMQRNDFREAYRDRELCSPSFWNSEHLPAGETIQRYTSAIFDDIAWIAGGVLARLQQADDLSLLEQRQMIFQRSLGLTLPSKAENAVVSLGFPYIHAKYFDLDLKRPEEPRVRPSTLLQQYVAENRSGGCVAAGIAAPPCEHAGGSVMTQAWSQIAPFIMPPDATNHAYLESPNPPLVQ